MVIIRVKYYSWRVRSWTAVDALSWYSKYGQGYSCFSCGAGVVQNTFVGRQPYKIASNLDKFHVTLMTSLTFSRHVVTLSTLTTLQRASLLKQTAMKTI